MSTRTMTVVLIALLTATLPLDAAEPAALNDWQNVQALPFGADLRISLERAQTVRGRLESVTEDKLELRLPDGKHRTVDASQVVRIHRIHKDSIANGALIGLGVGAAAGAIAGAVQDPERTDLTRSGSALIFGSLGAAIGTGIGAIADSAKVEYELVYERPASNQTGSARENLGGLGDARVASAVRLGTSY